jgi:photosystem II stability/assembly factor-like uncharacterized protein
MLIPLHCFHMFRLAFSVVFLFAGLSSSYAQWEIKESHTTADLRGIANVGQGIAWASGTQGTVLRTTDEGATWQRCATPPDAEKLDFRGIQAFDQNTAIVMSSGKGDLSRLYKTTDACKSWKLLFTNPDKDGFWDAIQFEPGSGNDKGRIGHLIGDPVNGRFTELMTYKGGEEWFSTGGPGAEPARAKAGETIFAASNSAMILIRNSPLFVTGGKTSRSRTLELHVKHDPTIFWDFIGGSIPLSNGVSAGAFSVAANLGPDSVADADAAKFTERPTHMGDKLVAVGGDYQKPDETRGTAAFTNDGGDHWIAAQTPPSGYRSDVAYDPTTKTWITVGPNGTDISRDDGKNWTALKPTAQDAPDADKNWNALSLPFVVGPKGRTGKLNAKTLAP